MTADELLGLVANYGGACWACGFADSAQDAQATAACAAALRRQVEAEVKRLHAEAAALRRQVEGQVARIAAQSEILARQAERAADVTPEENP
jgi:hypothetical protein